MWNMMTDFMPRRTNRGMNTITAMVVGAGVGVAAWEMIRRNGKGISADQMMKLSKPIMKAIKG